MGQLATMIPAGTRVVFLADRGFPNGPLMRYLQELNWWFRIRIKKDSVIRALDGGSLHPGDLKLRKGRAFFLKNASFSGCDGLTFGALDAYHAKEEWYILSWGGDFLKTFKDYGRRFDIEECFRDEKSGGFKLEDTKIRTAGMIDHLLLVMSVAMTMMVLSGIGTVESGDRRSVDPHTKRGLSYFQIGLRKLGQIGHSPRLLRQFLRYGPLPFDYEPEPVSVSRKADKERQLEEWHFDEYHLHDTFIEVA
jgi:hypothetical protein